MFVNAVLEAWAAIKRKYQGPKRVAPGMVGSDQTPDAYILKAKSLQRGGDLGAAEMILRRGLHAHPEDPTLKRQFAELAMARGDWAEAITRWQAILEISKDEAPPAVFVRLSRALRGIGQIKGAEAIVRRGLSKHPTDIKLITELAELAILKENWSEATDLLQSVLEIAGDSVRAPVYAQLSVALRAQRDIDAAKSTIERGLSLHPQNVKLLRELSVVTSAQNSDTAAAGSEVAIAAKDRNAWRKLFPNQARESFIKSKCFRDNNLFVQACAFAMNFSHEKAQKTVEWANECRLSWIRSGREEAWRKLNDADKCEFIYDLLEDVIRREVKSNDFEEPLTMGVSSGYDSRTILYFLRSLGISPDTYTFGQIGNYDFDYVSFMSKEESLKTHIFDTSVLNWSLESLENYASQSQDFPISPRIPAGAALDSMIAHRLEIHGHLGDSLTGIQQNPEESWEQALRFFCTLSDRFKFQWLFAPDELAAFLPDGPFIDYGSLAFSRQLDLGYLEAQSMRPLNTPSVDYLFPFEDPNWVGFWLNRSPAETAGQALWLHFVQWLGASEFAELQDVKVYSRSAGRVKMGEFLYGKNGKVDLGSSDKILDSHGTRHFCLFACHSNNPQFRQMVKKSISRLRKREIFQDALIDGIMRNFAARVPNSDSMLNGLIAIDVMAEVERFDQP